MVEPLLVMLDHKHPKPLDRGKLDIAVEARSVEQFLLRLRYHMVDANRGALVPVRRTADEGNVHALFRTVVSNNILVRVLQVLKRNLRSVAILQLISLQLRIILIGAHDAHQSGRARLGQNAGTHLHVAVACVSYDLVLFVLRRTARNVTRQRIESERFRERWLSGTIAKARERARQNDGVVVGVAVVLDILVIERREFLQRADEELHLEEMRRSFHGATQRDIVSGYGTRRSYVPELHSLVVSLHICLQQRKQRRPGSVRTFIGGYGEGRREVIQISVGEHSQTVYDSPQIGVAERNRCGGGKGSELRILLDAPIEGILPHRSLSRNHLQRIRNKKTLMVTAGDEEGKEGVEVDGLRVICICKVQFHRQNRFHLLDYVCRTKHTPILQRRVASRRESAGGRLSLRHVVAVDLYTVDVGNDSMGVTETDLIDTDVRGTIEDGAEVLRARRLDSGLSENHLLPVAVVKVELSPFTREFVGEGPAIALVDRGIQNKLGIPKPLRNFQNHISIDTIQLDPSPTAPLLLITVLHHQLVSVILIRLDACLHNTRFVIIELGRNEQITRLRIIRYREYLVVSIHPRLFNDAQIVFSILALETTTSSQKQQEKKGENERSHDNNKWREGIRSLTP